LQTKRDRIVGGGIVSVQCCDDIDLIGQSIAVRRLGDAEVEKFHLVEPQALCQRFGRLHQYAAGFNAVNAALTQGFDKQVVNDEPQIRLARNVIGQRRALIAGWQFFEQFFNELIQVIHLLQLTPRIKVELALAGEDMQLFE